MQHIYADVHDWIWKKHNIDRFNGEKFKAQWGTIRSIAMRFKKIDDLKYHLFDTANPKAYLKHGVAKYLWAEKQRLEKFQEFVNNLNDDNAQSAIINLASEMQKALNK